MITNGTTSTVEVRLNGKLIYQTSGASLGTVGVSTIQIGNDTGAQAFNIVVDWVSPTKVRRTRVLGERGMLEADTLTADLFFYENGEVGIVWSATQQFRGVSEGNVTRYALRREEPLRVEHERFFGFLAGDTEADVVTLGGHPGARDPGQGLKARH